MADSKKLILFTSGFPFGYGESFLENEIIHLAGAFQEIIIVPKTPYEEGNTRTLPPNCEVHPFHFSSRSIKSLKYFFTLGVIKEMIQIFFSKNNFKKLKILIGLMIVLSHFLSYKTPIQILDSFHGLMVGMFILKDTHTITYRFVL